MRYSHSELKSKKEKLKGRGILIFTFLILNVSFGIAACSLRQPALERPTLPLLEATAEDLASLLERREGALRTVKGLFSAEVKSPALPIAQTVYGTLFYSRTEALRLQGFDRFGGRIFDFVLEPARYHLHVPSERRRVTGSPAELARTGGISDSVRLSVLAMSGLLGVEPIQPGARVILEEDHDLYRLDVRASHPDPVREGAVTRQIWFERHAFNVVREKRFAPDGALIGTLELADFRPAMSEPEGATIADLPSSQGLVLPFQIKATNGENDGRIDITFSEIHPNVPLRDGDLRLALRLTGHGRGALT